MTFYLTPYIFNFMPRLSTRWLLHVDWWRVYKKGAYLSCARRGFSIPILPQDALLTLHLEVAWV